MIQICPNCRSTFELIGTLDYSAPSLQTINCPVCSQSIWVASGLLPQRWSVGKILNYVTPVTVAIPVTPPADDSPVWSHLSIPGLDVLGQGINKIAIWVIVVLVLIVLIKWEKKND